MEFVYFKSVTCLAMVIALFLAFLNILNVENINIMATSKSMKL
jgi:hypothetical protein